MMPRGYHALTVLLLALALLLGVEDRPLDTAACLVVALAWESPGAFLWVASRVE